MAGYSITNGLCTLADVKAALRIPDCNDDYRISFCIDAASRAIENHCQRRFFQDQQASARTYIAENPWLVQLDDFMALTGLVVATDYAGNGTYGQIWSNPIPNVDGTIAGGDFQLEPLNGLINGQPWAFTKMRAVRSFYFPVYGGIAYPKPYTQALVKVTAQWGWNYIPVDVQKACVFESIKLLKTDDTPFGVTPFPETGIVTQKPGLHPAAAKLLMPYREAGVLVA
jgi:hypothetical protein